MKHLIINYWPVVLVIGGFIAMLTLMLFFSNGTYIVHGIESIALNGIA